MNRKEILSSSGYLKLFFEDYTNNSNNTPRQIVICDGEITEWNNADIEKPTDEEIVSWKNTVETRYNNSNIKGDRKLAYPLVEEQLDKLWHDIDNGTLNKTGEFYTALKAVKDNNPKESE